jgi:outer membrane protein assembly factor BamB
MKQLLVLFLLAILFGCESNPKITEWRGTGRSGIFDETNLLKEWPAEGPSAIWEVESAGNGYSSPVIADGFVYVTGEIDSLGYLFKFDDKGNEIWRSGYGGEWTTNFFGSRGMPTLVDNLIYICSGLGDIVCLDVENGKQLWHKNMVADFGGVSPRFGFAQALAADGERVFCFPGGAEHNAVALNRFTGELVWSAPCFGERPAYNSPKLIVNGERKILAGFSAYHLLGLDAETGQLLWSHEQTNTKPEEREPGNGDTHANTIVYDGGFIYYSAGDGNCGVKLKLNAEGTAIGQVWQTNMMDNYMGGMVKINNQLYASSHQKKQLIAIDCETAAKTDSLKIGRGSTIYADGMIYFYNEQGMVYLVDASANMKEAGSFKLTKGTKEHFAHPVIHKGVLYLRHGNYLGAFDIKRQS